MEYIVAHSNTRPLHAFAIFRSKNPTIAILSRAAWTQSLLYTQGGEDEIGTNSKTAYTDSSLWSGMMIGMGLGPGTGSRKAEGMAVAARSKVP